MSCEVVFLCHGETEGDVRHVVDGWLDVDLSARGAADAAEAGVLLKATGYRFDAVFTSVLKRSIKTAWGAVGACDSVSGAFMSSWRLNDRHYGALQGMDKAEAAKLCCLSSFDQAPPLLDREDDRHPCNESTYAFVPHLALPCGESLKEVQERVLPQWFDSIGPCVKAGRRVLVVAHKDTLRIICMHLKGVTPDEISELDIPTAVPFVYELDANMKCMKDYRLVDRGSLTPHISQAAGGFKICMFSVKPCDASLVASLQVEFPGSFFFESPCNLETAKLCKGAQAVCLYTQDDCGKDIVAIWKTYGIKLVLLRCRNNEKLDIDACHAADIKVVSVRDNSVAPLGEHAVSLAICLNRRLHRASNRTRDDNYMLGGLVGIDFNGKSCGIVGTGATGLAAAKCFEAFGMKIFCCGPNVFPDEFAALGARFVTLHELYGACDVISLHVKLSNETKHMIDAAAIASMKPGVILVNVSRGPLIRNEALIDGLCSGQIGGAGLDVFDGQENIFGRDWSKVDKSDLAAAFDTTFLKLVNLPNVLVTPRTCFLTELSLQRTVDHVVSNARAFANGLQLHHEVRRESKVQLPDELSVTVGEQVVSTAEVELISPDFVLTVFSADTLWRTHLAALVRAFPRTVCLDVTCSSQSAALCNGSKAVCLFVNDDASRDVLSIFRDNGISLILMRCAGFDRVDMAAAKEFGIRVARVPAYSPYAVAEHAVALALTLNRHLVQIYNRVRLGAYDQIGLISKDFEGKTVGIVGTGKIGQIAAKIFKNLGMKVICCDKYQNDVIKVELGLPYKEMDEVLAESDVLSIHVPLMPSTQYMINKDSIAKMKPGVIVINCSRGGLVDTKALIEGLLSGRIGAAGLDVYENEGGFFFKNFTEVDKVDAEHRDDTFVLLKSLPNVIVTPHSAFLTIDALDAICNTTIFNAKQFVQDEPLSNEVK